MATFYTRSRIFVWLIIGLIIINLSTVATVIYHIRQTKKDISFQTDTLYSKMPVRQYSKFIVEQLDFTPEQVASYNKINDGYKRQAASITREMSRLRIEMIKEIIKTITDSTTLIKLSEELGSQHTALKNFTINYLLQIKAICTPEQQQKLIPMYKRMLYPEPYQQDNRRRNHKDPDNKRK